MAKDINYSFPVGGSVFEGSGIGGGGGDGTTGTIGIPSDGDYTDGVLPMASTDTVANTFDSVNKLLLALADPQAGLLTGQSLVLSGASFYTGVLPNGLSGDWVTTAGTTVQNVTNDSTIVASTPNTADRFRAGQANNQSSAGVLTLECDGVDQEVYSIADNGVGVGVDLEVTALDVYNDIWQKANAQANLTLTEGRKQIVIKHDEAGDTNVTTVYHDDVASAPAFDVSPTSAENTPVDKWLSGINHYGVGSTFDVSYTAASGIFRKTYHPSAVSRITDNAGTVNKAVNPGSVPSVNDTFAISNELVTLGADGSSGANDAVLSVDLNKPDGQQVSDSASALSRRINTYGVVSTNTTDAFLDEDKRLENDTDTSFDSTTSLDNGDAQVRNGTLVYGDTDYPAKTGDQEYQRKFTKASASNGALTFSGISFIDIDPYGTGDLNVLLQLDDDDLYFDLGRVFGDDNGDGSGSSRANSQGARTSGSAGTVNFSFGTASTGDNGNEYRVIIIFRNNNDSITNITSS